MSEQQLTVQLMNIVYVALCYANDDFISLITIWKTQSDVFKIVRQIQLLGFSMELHEIYYKDSG